MEGGVIKIFQSYKKPFKFYNSRGWIGHCIGKLYNLVDSRPLQNFCTLWW